MRICIVNITRIPDEHMPAMEDTVRKIAGRVTAPGTELFVRAPKTGPTSEFEKMADFRDPYFCHLIVNQVIETINAADEEDFDAFVVNCFDDPGVRQARSFARGLVFGICEPTFGYAAQMGGRLGGLVPSLPGQVAFVENQVREFGLWDRFITNGVQADEGDTAKDYGAAMGRPEIMTERLLRQSARLVDQGAEAIVSACGGIGMLFELANIYSLQHRGQTIPIINPLSIAVKTAENSVLFRKQLGLPVFERNRARENAARFRKEWNLPDHARRPAR
jgi:allantoin racemase